MTTEDSVLDDLFHGCALAAFVEQAVTEQGWPTPELVRRLAFQYYEEALALKNAATTPTTTS